MTTVQNLILDLRQKPGFSTKASDLKITRLTNPVSWLVLGLDLRQKPGFSTKVSDLKITRVTNPVSWGESLPTPPTLPYSPSLATAVEIARIIARLANSILN